MCNTLIFLYFYYVSHCGVQCAFWTRNRDTTVLVISADPVTDLLEQRYIVNTYTKLPYLPEYRP